MLLNVGLERKITEIPIVQIRPRKNKLRMVYEHDQMRELAQNIGKNGLIHPIEVRRINTTEYEVISGERRLRAAIMCGKKKISCIVIDCDDKQASIMSLSENMQRSGLNFFEEAQSIDWLMKEYKMSRQETALMLGRKLSYVISKLKLLKLNEEEQSIITRYMLTEHHANALIKIEDPVIRRIALSEIIERGMNVSQTEQYIDGILESTDSKFIRKQKNKVIIKNIEIFENTICKAIDLMQRSGLAANAERRDESGCIEYIIRIPKARKTKEKRNSKTA